MNLLSGSLKPPHEAESYTRPEREKQGSLSVAIDLTTKQPHTNHAPPSAGLSNWDVCLLLISFAASYPYKATETMLLIL